MSRGLGRVQQEVMNLIDELHDRPPHERWVSVVQVAGPDAAAARLESIRRAFRTLAARGLVERAATGVMRVRKPLTKAEAARELRMIFKAQRALEEAEDEVATLYRGYRLHYPADDEYRNFARAIASDRRRRLRKLGKPSE